MTSKLDTDGETQRELHNRRVFRAWMWAGTGCYLLASFALYQWGHQAGPWRVVWAVLPILFAAWMLTIVVLRVRRMDEYQVKLLVPGLAVGFTVTVFAAITLGTLDSAGFTIPNAGWAVAILGLVAWEFTNLLVKAPTV